MREKLAQALDYISDEKIADAAAPRKGKKRILFRAIAAVLAVVIFLNLPFIPGKVNASEIALASGTRKPDRPNRDDYEIWEDFRADLDIYDARHRVVRPRCPGG